MTNRDEQKPMQKADRGTAAPSAPVNPADPIAMALRSHVLPVKHCNPGQATEVKAMCREILALNLNYMDSLQLRGVIAQRAGCHHAAMDMFRKAIALNHRNPERHLNIGLACSALGRWENFVEHFREAIRLEPN